jgi:aspartate aminotransferase
MELSTRLDTVIESQTLAMTKKARELKEKGHDVINLSIGEPDFDTPLSICDAATVTMQHGDTHYTPVLGSLKFRQAIQSKLKRENNLDFELNQIIVSNGAKQSLFNAIMSIINPGDEVILPSPFWVSYPSMVKFAGGICKEIRSSIESDFKVSAQQIEAEITDKTKMIIFSSPCNPSGSVLSLKDLQEWVSVLEKYPNITIVSDEIYEKINYTDKFISIASFPSIKDRVVVVNGLSKGFAMTGWRIGYLAGPTELVKACEKFQGLISSGANSIAQSAGCEALNGDQSEVSRMRDIFENRRNLMCEHLKNIPGIKVNIPEGAFYCFPDVSYYVNKSYNNYKINNTEDLCIYLLENALVSTVSGDAFGSPECIRLSYATSEDLIIESIRRIKTALEQLR